MHPPTGANQYLRTQVSSSKPLELVVLLYDGALRWTATASDAMRRGDIPTRRHALSKAMAIVSELQSTLDMERGGPIASNLDDLYKWINSRLLDAIVKQDAKPIDEARRILETLRGAWHTIATAPVGADAGVAATAGARP
jgi:flagellar protein FliS